MWYFTQPLRKKREIYRNIKINKHEYRAGVAELNVHLLETQNGGHTDRQTDRQTDRRQTSDRHTGVCIELIRN